MSDRPPTLSPAQERTLLDALLSGSSPLPDLASFLNLSLLDLLELIASPAIQARLVAVEQAAAHALRLRASAHLPEILDALTDTLESYRRDYKLLEHREGELAAHQRRHERIHMRRAATTILRLTRFSPLPPDALLTTRPSSRARATLNSLPSPPRREDSRVPLTSCDDSRAPLLSREAAPVDSQGRQPLVEPAPRHAEPRRGGTQTTHDRAARSSASHIQHPTLATPGPAP